MGEAGLPVEMGIPTGTSDFFGSGLWPLLLVSGGFCLETVNVTLDGDFCHLREKAAGLTLVLAAGTQAASQ